MQREREEEPTKLKDESQRDNLDSHSCLKHQHIHNCQKCPLDRDKMVEPEVALDYFIFNYTERYLT